MMFLLQDAATLWRARSLAWVLTRREMQARHAGAAGGIGWAYAQPLLMVAAYYLVFDVVFAMRLGDQAPTKSAGVFLIVGSLPWMAFSDAVQRAMNSLIDAGGLLQKNALPPVLFPVRAVMASALIFGPLVVLVAVLYAPLHHFAWPVVMLLPLLLAQGLLSLLLGYLLAVLAAALRDTVQVVAFFFSVGIFMSPVLFPLSLFPEGWRWVLWLNPMSALVVGYQAVLLQGQWPALQVWGVIVVWLALTGLVLNTVLQRSKDQLVDWL